MKAIKFYLSALSAERTKQDAGRPIVYSECSSLSGNAKDGWCHNFTKISIPKLFSLSLSEASDKCGLIRNSYSVISLVASTIISSRF